MCDRLVSAGVTSVLNFAPLVLNVPEGVDVRKVDLSIELQILAFHAQRRYAERFGQAADQAVPDQVVPNQAGPNQAVLNQAALNQAVAEA
jgi:redox-sensing transcriptional repressor